MPDSHDEIKAAQAFLDDNPSVDDVASSILDTADRKEVTVHFGLGNNKLRGMDLAPSPDQKSVVVASVTPECKGYGVIQPGSELFKINALDVTTMDYTAVSCR